MRGCPQSRHRPAPALRYPPLQIRIGAEVFAHRCIARGDGAVAAFHAASYSMFFMEFNLIAMGRIFPESTGNDQ